MQTSAVPPGACGVTRDQNKHDVRRVVTAAALAFPRHALSFDFLRYLLKCGTCSGYDIRSII